jgi:hypothetical protein
MQLYSLDGCCGVREIDGISDCASAEEAMKELLVEEADHDTTDQFDARPFIIFTAITRVKGGRKTITYGDDFKNYILSNNLGTVVEMGPETNPGTGNKLKLYVWTPNYATLNKLQAKLVKEREKEKEETTLCNDPDCIYCASRRAIG